MRKCKEICRKFPIKFPAVCAGFLLCLFLVAIMKVRPIHAYLEDEKKVVNTMNIGENEIVIEEQFETPEKGKKTMKQPLVKNTGPVDCYVRGKVVLSDSRAAKYFVYEYQEKNGWNTKDWIMDEDGWMYYASVLQSGESTTPVFNYIEISPDLPDSFFDFSIDLIFESVQSEHFTDAKTAFQALAKGGVS